MAKHYYFIFLLGWVKAISENKSCEQYSISGALRKAVLRGTLVRENAQPFSKIQPFILQKHYYFLPSKL